MVQYISKDTVVAEIKRLLNKYISVDSFNYGIHQDLSNLLSFLDTFEVKEVDLDEHQIADIIENLFPTDQFIESETLLLDREEAIIFAKHFFELGMAVRNKAQKGE